MEQFRLAIVNDIQIIEDTEHGFAMSVQKNRNITEHDKGAFMEATHYKANGTFINNGYYIFEALDATYQPSKGNLDVQLFHTAIDFFFKSILDTEYFIKSIPECSTLYTGVKKVVWR